LGFSSAGQRALEVNVTDGSGSDTATWTLNVSNVNLAPYITQELTGTQVSTQLVLEARANDPDGIGNIGGCTVQHKGQDDVSWATAAGSYQPGKCTYVLTASSTNASGSAYGAGAWVSTAMTFTDLEGLSANTSALAQIPNATIPESITNGTVLITINDVQQSLEMVNSAQPVIKALFVTQRGGNLRIRR
ncbi:hypothetical protein COY28_02725, partial [Candidatus Woesearchaeota archaeon CG_4_10_14_0_2_um_filter_57_5]